MATLYQLESAPRFLLEMLLKKRSLALFPGIVRLQIVSPEQLMALFPTKGRGCLPENEAGRQESRAKQHFQTTSCEPLDLILLEMGTIPVLFSSLN